MDFESDAKSFFLFYCQGVHWIFRGTLLQNTNKSITMFGGVDQSPINGGDPIKKLITDVTLVSEDVPMSVWFNQSTNCQDTVGTNVCVVKDPSHMQRSAMPLALAHP